MTPLVRHRRAAGFTLIELMIVVAIIGILASIALPAYSDYTKRAKLSEAILAASACRTSITEIYQSATALPAANSWGCESATSASKYVASIITDGTGIVTVASQGISGVTTGVKLSPLKANGSAASAVGDAIASWKCEPTIAAQAKYLPGSCRG